MKFNNRFKCKSNINGYFEMTDKGTIWLFRKPLEKVNTYAFSFNHKVSIKYFFD